VYDRDYREKILGSWHHRGYLPHFDEAGVIQHVTFHWGDALAKGALERMQRLVDGLPEGDRHTELRRRIEQWLDIGHGSCPLRDPELADGVQKTLLHFDGERYELYAWAIMPNHVHALLACRPGYEMGKIVWGWKSFTGRLISSRLQGGDGGRRGRTLWGREYFDRFIRGERHYGYVVRYIHENPVKARLVAKAEDWPWSSAFEERK
jgi:REP element-mobilizing transposase RayT